MNDKLKRAMDYLGTNWVLAKGSTYDAKRRNTGGICKSLLPVVVRAIARGRI